MNTPDLNPISNPDQAVDQVLHALGQTQPPRHLNQRLLANLEARAAATRKTASVSEFLTALHIAPAIPATLRARLQSCRHSLRLNATFVAEVGLAAATALIAAAAILTANHLSPAHPRQRFHLLRSFDLGVHRPDSRIFAVGF